ncbi:MAG: hypothetical protein IPM51_11805 [Sphingobacteriaceae bacterium]|nr:hypothetical protein [Sphingobacteriaceae bacterium]
MRVLLMQGDVTGGISNAIKSTEGKSEGTYIAVLILLFTLILLCGFGYVMGKWIPNFISTFKETMDDQRKHDAEQRDKERDLFLKQIEHERSRSDITGTTERAYFKQMLTELCENNTQCTHKLTEAIDKLDKRLDGNKNA